MKSITLIAHNLRSCENVGSLLRTCEGLGIDQVILSGYTPCPVMKNDPRLPHLAIKISKRISKSALGAENMVNWQHANNLAEKLQELKNDGYVIVGIEQDKRSINIKDIPVCDKIALIMGREVEGIEPEIIELCDIVAEIPMVGKKESFNVSIAAAISLYSVKYMVD